MSNAPFSDRAMLRLWEKTKGKPWEPRGGTNIPDIQKLVRAGFIRITNGRCMFEVIPDSMCTWTDAGKLAMEAIISRTDAGRTALQEESRG